MALLIHRGVPGDIEQKVRKRFAFISAIEIMFNILLKISIIQQTKNDRSVAQMHNQYKP